MNLRIAAVIVACLMVGAAILIAPRLSSAPEKTAEVPDQASENDFEAQISEVRKNLDANKLASLTFFEEQTLKLSGAEAAPWFDSLLTFWDKQMRPGIAAEYVYRKAELTGKTEDWFNAGNRYLGISRFFEETDRMALIDKAIECLDKAYTQAPSDNTIKTRLASAYVEGGKDPMKGIFLLREVVAEEPDNIDAQMNLGFFSMQSGQFEKAVDRFRKVLEIDPSLGEVRIYLSEALDAAGNREDALKELNQIIKSGADSFLVQEAQKRIDAIQNSTN
jgi:tetratricopeptide (TPR) repeat protein